MDITFLQLVIDTWQLRSRDMTFLQHVRKHRAAQWILQSTFEEMRQGWEGLREAFGPSEGEQLRMLGTRREVGRAGVGSEAEGEVRRKKELGWWVASLSKKSTSSSSCQAPEATGSET